MTTLSRADFARCIDHCLFRPDATRQDVERLCSEARAHSFHGVCVHGSRVELAAALLENTDLKVTCLVGFPLGASESDAKRYEAEAAIDLGAQEIELVLNTGRLKEGDYRYVLRELRDVAEAAEERPVTVALEVGLLTAEEVLKACALALDSGVKLVSTGTGLGRAATELEVKALRAAVGPKFGVKAGGRFETAAVARALIAAGATRLGTTDSVSLVAEPAA